MSQAAFLPDNRSGLFFSGVVGGHTGGYFHVQTGSASIRARKATSCLLMPENGDCVLLFSDREDYFILSILTRNADAARENRIAFEGPTRFAIEQGGFTLQAEQEIQMATEGAIGLTGGEIRADAHKAEAHIDQCSFFGRVLKVQVEVIRSAARIIDHLVKRWTLQADSSVRYVKEHDEVQAGSARYLTEQTLTMHSKNAVHTAEDLVSINGGQINLS